MFHFLKSDMKTHSALVGSEVEMLFYGYLFMVYILLFISVFNLREATALQNG